MKNTRPASRHSLLCAAHGMYRLTAEPCACVPVHGHIGAFFAAAAAAGKTATPVPQHNQHTTMLAGWRWFKAFVQKAALAAQG